MPSPDKTELRRILRARLALMTRADKAAASEKIREVIRSLPRWQEAHTIAAYAALPGEPDLEPLRWIPNRRVLLPRVSGDNLVFHQVACASDLRPGAFGVLEPDPGHCPVADVSLADIILVPGLGFTAEGARLGRGRGYYDRFLSAIPARVLRVGVCFAEQIVAGIPFEAHDQAVDIVLAPKSHRQR